MTQKATNRTSGAATGDRALRLVRFLLALSLPIGSLGLSVLAQASPTEGDVKAAYLFNFGKFVEWPQQRDPSRFTICIVGKDDFGITLDSLIANESIQGRKITARRLTSIAGAETCDMAYIGTSETQRVAAELDTLKDKPVLTVSSLPGFLDHGGMIQFFLASNKVRFAVNLSSVERAHLMLSSELLKVAVAVTSGPVNRGHEVAP